MSIITSLLLQMLSQQKIEIAMKRAMGGTIRRIYMELTVESLLMVLLGSALSLGVIALFPVIIHSLPVSVYRKYPLAISYSTLFAVVGTSVGMAVVCELPCLVALKRLSVAELLR
jgi:ABC-type antimicrobial peptide transport system permease subunit